MTVADRQRLVTLRYRPRNIGRTSRFPRDSFIDRMLVLMLVSRALAVFGIKGRRGAVVVVAD